MLKLIKSLPANNVPYGAAVDAVYLQNLKMKKKKKTINYVSFGYF